MRGKKRIFSEFEGKIDEKTKVTWELLCDIRDIMRTMKDEIILVKERKK